MKFLSTKNITKNTLIILLFLVLIILLLIFIYLDKKIDQKQNKELFESKDNLITFSLKTHSLDKDIKIEESKFLSYNNGTFTEISDKINEISSTNMPHVLLDNNQKQKMGMLVNNISDYDSLYAKPTHGSATSYNVGIYRFYITGKLKNGRNKRFHYDIIAPKEDFEKPFIHDLERGQDKVFILNNEFFSAQGFVHGGTDTFQFIPKRKTPSKFELLIREDTNVSDLKIGLIWTGTNETIEPTIITKYSTYKSESFDSKRNNTVMIFDANKHVSSNSPFKLSGIQNSVSKSINGLYTNNINLVDSPEKNFHTKNNITIKSSDNYKESIDLIYSFDSTTDLLNIGIMQFKFDISNNNVNIGDFVNNILKKIYIGEHNLINKNYSLDYGNNAIYLLLIKNDIYAMDHVKKWLNNYIGQSYYPKEKYFICGFEYADGGYNNNNVDYISLGCYNSNVSAGSYLNDVNSVKECYKQAKNGGYKYFGLSETPKIEYILLLVKNENQYKDVQNLHEVECYINGSNVLRDGNHTVSATFLKKNDDGLTPNFSDSMEGPWSSGVGASNIYNGNTTSGLAHGTSLRQGPSHNRGYNDLLITINPGISYSDIQRIIVYNRTDCCHGRYGYIMDSFQLLDENQNVIAECKHPSTFQTHKKFYINYIGPKDDPTNGGYPVKTSDNLDFVLTPLSETFKTDKKKCWGVNDWKQASFNGPSTCGETGGNDKFYMYSVGNDTPDDYNSRNLYRCADEGEECECNGAVLMGEKWNNGNNPSSGVRDFENMTSDENRYKVKHTNGSIMCNDASFRRSLVDNYLRGKMKQCWCASSN